MPDDEPAHSPAAERVERCLTVRGVDSDEVIPADRARQLAAALIAAANEADGLTKTLSSPAPARHPSGWRAELSAWGCGRPKSANVQATAKVRR
jgi:hypothetical protein